MPPVSCPDIHLFPRFFILHPASVILYNHPMTAKRWLLFVLSIVVGIGLGLLYGWVISPVQYIDTTPSTLRVDFRTDYTLMVAETFESEQDIEAAARRLALLGSEPPAKIATSALDFARQNDYAPTDIELIENLAVGLQVWQPGGVVPPDRNAAGTTPAVQSPGAQP